MFDVGFVVFLRISVGRLNGLLFTGSRSVRWLDWSGAGFSIAKYRTPGKEKESVREKEKVCVMDPRRDRRLYWITKNNLHRGITSGTLVRSRPNLISLIEVHRTSVLQKHDRGISMHTHIIVLLNYFTFVSRDGDCKSFVRSPAAVRCFVSPEIIAMPDSTFFSTYGADDRESNNICQPYTALTVAIVCRINAELIRCKWRNLKMNKPL